MIAGIFFIFFVALFFFYFFVEDATTMLAICIVLFSLFVLIASFIYER